MNTTNSTVSSRSLAPSEYLKSLGKCRVRFVISLSRSYVSLYIGRCLYWAKIYQPERRKGSKSQFAEGAHASVGVRLGGAGLAAVGEVQNPRDGGRVLRGRPVAVSNKGFSARALKS